MSYSPTLCSPDFALLGTYKLELHRDSADFVLGAVSRSKVKELLDLVRYEDACSLLMILLYQLL
jgi:hypothetical protein